MEAGKQSNTGEYRRSFSSLIHIIPVIVMILSLTSISGCKDDKPPEPQISPTQELLMGSWSRYNNKVYTLLIIRSNGNWSSDLRVEGATSKIIERKGESTGTWKLDENNLIVDVLSSEMEDVWPVGTMTLEIVSIDKKEMTLKYPNSRLVTWKRARVEKPEKKEGSVNPVLSMKPLVVNLNKISSNDKDRYLCLAIDLHLDEMPESQEVPKLHPKMWDSAIMYLSSLLYNDVRTFDSMKIVTDRLTRILNPYLDGLLAEIVSTHVMISSSMDKVDEFIIEHSPPPALETTAEGDKAGADKGKDAQKGDEKKKDEKKKEEKAPAEKDKKK